MKKIGFIGTGNMGGALAAAVCSAGYAADVVLCDSNTEKAEKLASELGCSATDISKTVLGCDYIFLGVKPQFLSGVADEIRPALVNRGSEPVFISMAAGVCIGKIEKMLGKDYPIIRIMPNTPVKIGRGTVLYTVNGKVSDENEKDFLSFMKNAGFLDRIDENKIDAASALSGCGPAFVYMFIEALSDGGVYCGLPRDKALRYAVETVVGAAELVANSGEHPGSLKDAVCSPAGSTIEGVRTLEEGGFRGTVTDAVISAYERTKELGK